MKSTTKPRTILRNQKKSSGKKAQKIHFINQLQTYYHNAGDWNISPLGYYYDFFKDYNVVTHSMYGGAVNWQEIDRDDIVIIGGGGIIGRNLEKSSKFFNRLLNTCDTVIGWGIGVSRDNPITKTTIKFDKFKLLGIRDYDNPLDLPYLPCVSCKMPQLLYSKNTKPKRKIGVISHGGFRVEGLPYDSMTNRASAEEITRFIADSEGIVTSSYHAALWSMWMGKKAVIAGPEWSLKFRHYEHAPEYLALDEVREENVERAMSRAKVYEGWREDAVARNDEFFLEVAALIQQVIPVAGNDWQQVYEMKRISQLMAWNKELREEIKETNARLDVLEESTRRSKPESKVAGSNRKKVKEDKPLAQRGNERVF